MNSVCSHILVQWFFKLLMYVRHWVYFMPVSSADVQIVRVHKTVTIVSTKKGSLNDRWMSFFLSYFFCCFFLSLHEGEFWSVQFLFILQFLSSFKSFKLCFIDLAALLSVRFNFPLCEFIIQEFGHFMGVHRWKQKDSKCYWIKEADRTLLLSPLNFG